MLLYGGPFLLVGSIPALFYALGPGWPVLAIVLLLFALIGAEFIASKGDGAAVESDGAYRALFYAFVPLQLALIAWAVRVCGGETFAEALGLLFAVGVTTGVFGMLAAHELVHSPRTGERVLGALMLSGMLYRHFRIAHVHAHHRFAATGRDSVTARLGESFYAFLPRAAAGQLMEAWRFERARLRRGRVFANRLAADAAIAVAILSAVLALWGWGGAIFFLGQSAVAIVVLELFNYVAHYGLERKRDAAGRLEPMDDRHSWNCSNVLVNRLIFNMGRHSWHHRRPTESYQRLRYAAAAPELPAGYAGSILLALAPPLWRRLMDGRVRALALERPDDARLAA
ncbi:MAG TPA: alkane 1-monooxygenase [Rhizomicrobium sp.]|jgi:alkane 1-monooxygenase|nr:alkane 1-monooxygenase [Rhizomicrobium sp.]